MPVTVADFQANVNHYLQLVTKQDILIVEDGKVIATLTQPPQEKKSRQSKFPQKLTKRKDSEKITSAVNSLVGVLPDNGMTLSDYRAERLAKYENFA